MAVSFDMLIRCYCAAPCDTADQGQHPRDGLPLGAGGPPAIPVPDRANGNHAAGANAAAGKGRTNIFSGYMYSVPPNEGILNTNMD
jgi:hypothetical protein